MAAHALPQLIKKLAKYLLMMTGLMLVFSLVGCQHEPSGLLNPKGVVALQERKLFFDTLALMLIVVLPVIIMSITFVYHYQVSHHIRDYKPNWSHSYLLESLWWGIPCAIIGVLAVMTWKKTHELDPYAPVPGVTQAPMVVQVIALPWKWLFIYPEENIATVNYLVVPVGRAVEYSITADNVPMSAFFIPQLGSQIYAMAGMRTKINLVANYAGTFEGMNAQFNGDGFSDMHFNVYAVDANKMQEWVNTVKQSSQALTSEKFNQLLIPSEHNLPAFYSGVEPNLFENAMDVYMQTYGTVHPRNNFATWTSTTH